MPFSYQTFKNAAANDASAPVYFSPFSSLHRNLEKAKEREIPNVSQETISNFYDAVKALAKWDQITKEEYDTAIAQLQGACATLRQTQVGEQNAMASLLTALSNISKELDNVDSDPLREQFAALQALTDVRFDEVPEIADASQKLEERR